MLRNPPAMQETWVWSLVWEDPLKKEMATHSSIPAWEIPQTEEPDGLQSMGSQRVGRAKLLQSCPTLCSPVDRGRPGCSVYGIFPGKNIGVGCHFLLQGIFLTDPGIKPTSLTSPALAGRFFTTSATWKSQRVGHDWANEHTSLKRGETYI